MIATYDLYKFIAIKKIKSELKKAQILSEKRNADLLAATKDGEKMEHVFVLLAFNWFPVRRGFFDEVECDFIC